MANVPDLGSASYDDLFQRFANAVRLIVKGTNIDAARGLIDRIQKEWQRRREIGDAIVSFDRPDVGMLAALGYHVGHAKGQPESVRREILRHVIEGELPMIHSVTYTEEWGKPSSYERLLKVVRFLQNNIESNEAKPNMKLAVKQWKEDLGWITSGLEEAIRATPPNAQ